MRLSRRQLAGTILTSAAATALAQTQTPLPANPGEELQLARDRMRTNSQALSKLDVPIGTEPALQFKA